MLRLSSCIKCIRYLNGYRYLSTATKGAKFKSVQEIREYLDRPDKSKDAMVNTNLNDDEDLSKIDDKLITKLLKLSGLSVENADIPTIQKRLSRQLSFINKLHEAEVAEDITNVSYARIMPRENKPLDFESFMAKIEEQKENKFPDEQSGSWDSVHLASISKDHYFVLRKGLMKNRD